MDSPAWLAYVTALGSVATPIIVLALTGIGWTLRSRIERRFLLEDKLREDRVGTYYKILEPFVILLMPDAAWQLDPKMRSKNKDQLATGKLVSLEYRHEAFRLSLIGSDEVMRAYNNLIQYFYQNKDGEFDRDKAVAVMKLLGTLLLEIRRSVGNESTDLDNLEMVEWFLTDARKYRELAK